MSTAPLKMLIYIIHLIARGQYWDLCYLLICFIPLFIYLVYEDYIEGFWPSYRVNFVITYGRNQATAKTYSYTCLFQQRRHPKQIFIAGDCIGESVSEKRFKLVFNHTKDLTSFQILLHHNFPYCEAVKLEEPNGFQPWSFQHKNFKQMISVYDGAQGQKLLLRTYIMDMNGRTHLINK